LPRPIQSALVTALLLTVGLTVFAVLIPDTHMEGGLLAWGGMIFYAALIGVGFMLVEIPLIQRFQLLLGYPILSLVAVLATLLFAGGVGSVLSQRWKTARLNRRVMLAGLWIAGLAVIYRVALPTLLDAVLKQPLAVRVLAVIVLTALLGIPMGIPFPSLMRLAGQFRQRVALLWAVNGVFSVLGSVLAVVMSMTWGFSWALLLGALLYLMLAGLSRVMEFG
jgi:predicted membrane-bound spermidine synthase